MAILDRIKDMYSPRSCSDSGQQQMLREEFKNRGHIQDYILRIFSQFLPVYNSRISWTRSCVFVFNTPTGIFIPWMHPVAFEIQQLIFEPKIISKLTQGEYQNPVHIHATKKSIKESKTYELLLQNSA